MAVSEVRIYIFATFIILLVGCSKSSERFQVDTTGSDINLADQLPGEWSSVCIFPPYSTNRLAEDSLGFSHDIESNSAIFSSDSISLLLTVNGELVTGSYEVGRRNIDFSKLGATCYSRDNAKFKIPQNGWPNAQHITISSDGAGMVSQ